MGKLSDPELLALLTGLSPAFVLIGIIFYTISQVCAVVISILSFISSRSNAKKLDAAHEKQRDIAHSVENVSQKVSSVAVTIKNGHGDK